MIRRENAEVTPKGKTDTAREAWVAGEQGQGHGACAYVSTKTKGQALEARPL
jgi:hypothetical protein